MTPKQFEEFILKQDWSISFERKVYNLFDFKLHPECDIVFCHGWHGVNINKLVIRRVHKSTN